jgi:DNA-binding transcriptional LysR family regulator
VQLRQLEYFIAISEQGSFTAAAAALQVAQPSLSAQVKRLEDELGAALFDRVPRGIVLTPAGRALLAEARMATTAARRAREAVREVVDATGGQLEIATVLSLAVGMLPEVISEWHTQRPKVVLGLREFRHRDSLEQAVLSGVGDLAVGPRPSRWPGTLVELEEEEFMIILPPGDPALDLSRVTLRGLADRDWVLYEESHGLSTFLESFCQRAGFHPRGSVRTGQVEAAARLAAAGVGPALVPHNVIPQSIERLARSASPPIRRPLAVYARNEFSPSARSFVDTLIRTFGQGSRARRRVEL